MVSEFLEGHSRRELCSAETIPLRCTLRKTGKPQLHLLHPEESEICIRLPTIVVVIAHSNGPDTIRIPELVKIKVVYVSQCLGVPCTQDEPGLVFKVLLLFPLALVKLSPITTHSSHSLDIVIVNLM